MPCSPVIAEGGPTRGHSGRSVLAHMSSKLPKPMMMGCGQGLGGARQAGGREDFGIASVGYIMRFAVGERVTGPLDRRDVQIYAVRKFSLCESCGRHHNAASVPKRNRRCCGILPGSENRRTLIFEDSRSRQASTTSLFTTSLPHSCMIGT